MPSRIKVAIAGAHTAVGRELVRSLEEREFPSESVAALVPEPQLAEASREDESLPLAPLKPEALHGVELAFFAGDARLSRAFVPAAVEAGAYVLDLSSAHRADAAVPLCAPPIAPFVRSERRIAACPDPLCTAIARALAPLKGSHRVDRITVTSLHSVSTRGGAAIRELERQTAALMNARPSEPKVFKHRVAFNAFPQVGEPEGREFGDERGVETELPRLLDRKDLAVGATCVRVPIFHGNAASVICEAASAIDPDSLRNSLKAAEGVKVLDDPEAAVYPTTQLAVGDDAILVGRIRADRAHAGAVALFIAYDAIRLAAVNALVVAEALIRG